MNFSLLMRAATLAKGQAWVEVSANGSTCRGGLIILTPRWRGFVSRRLFFAPLRARSAGHHQRASLNRGRGSSSFILGPVAPGLAEPPSSVGSSPTPHTTDGGGTREQ